MKEVLQRVLSYPSQKPRRYTTMWTLQGTSATAPLAGAQLLETLEIQAGPRELRIKNSTAGDHAAVLGNWTLDEYAAYHYAQHFKLPYEAPDPPVAGPCAYPTTCMTDAVQRMLDARGNGAMLRTKGKVANPPNHFGGGGDAMEI